MSNLSVTPTRVRDAGTPLRPISSHIDSLHGAMAPHADAGAGTIGAGAVRESFAAWGEALPHFGAAAERMIAALAGAASAYSRTDQTIGVAATLDDETRR